MFLQFHFLIKIEIVYQMRYINEVKNNIERYKDMKTEMIHARVDHHLKQEAELIFSALGINTSDAIRMFLTQVTLNQGIPFDVKIPNIETRNAIKDSREKKNLSALSIEDLDKIYDA